MSPATSRLRGAVFGPEFVTNAGTFRAGTAFAAFVPEVNAPVLLTCQHLFGPAGGLDQDVPAARMSQFAQGARLFDKWDGTAMGQAGRAVALPDADWSAPNSDVAAFVLQPQPGLVALRLSEQPLQIGDRAFLAGRVQSGAPPDQMLHAATSVGDLLSDGTDWISFDNQGLGLPGTSGAPVVDASGDVVGMVVRFDDSPLTVRIVPATRLRAMIGAVLMKR